MHSDQAVDAALYKNVCFSSSLASSPGKGSSAKNNSSSRDKMKQDSSSDNNDNDFAPTNETVTNPLMTEEKLINYLQTKSNQYPEARPAFRGTEHLRAPRCSFRRQKED